MTTVTTAARKRKRVTKREAEKVLAAVRKRYAAYVEAGYGPTLDMDFDWFGYGGVPAIVWEGGPYEWAVADPAGDVDEEMSSLAGRTVRVAPLNLPATVWTEPLTSWALAIYPSDWND